MYNTPQSDDRDNDFLANTRIPVSIREMPREHLNQMTNRYLEERGLNLAGLGDANSTSEEGSECEDILKCRHLIKKIEF